MAPAPALIETLALYLRNADLTLDRGHALAEAVEQCNAIRFTGRCMGEVAPVAERQRMRASNAATAWRELRCRQLPDRSLQEALALTQTWSAPPARGWLVEFVLEERDFSTDRRQSLAKQHKAMPDGSYPIENTGDLKNAIRAIGRAGSAKMAAVKRHIIRRARQLKATTLLPEGWVAAADDSIMSRSLVLEELFLPGGGGDGEVPLTGMDGDPTGSDGAPTTQIHLSPGAGTTAAGPSESVRVAQRALTEMGHYRGAIDGQYGPATTSAVQDMQRTHGIRAHGHVDGPTLEALDRNSSENAFEGIVSDD